MSWGRVVFLDSKLSPEIPELRIVELFPIIIHEGPGDPKLAYYSVPSVM